MTTQKYPVYDVFTPTRPARLAFVERISINDNVVTALRTPGKQLIVYGHTGSGKTTLLQNKLFQLYGNHITSRCMKGLAFEQLLLDAFDQLSPFYTAELASKTERAMEASLVADYLGIKSQIVAKTKEISEQKAHRILPPQLTAQALGRFLGAAKACWVIEDFHKTDPDTKTRLAQLMKVFMDMADEFPELKIVALGAVDTARQVVQCDNEMRNRVAEIGVPLMNEDEIKGIIEKGEMLLNVRFTGNTKSGILHYSNGLAAVCHHLCLNMCLAEHIEQTIDTQAALGIETLNSALKRYVEEASDTIKEVFDKALRRKKTRKYDNARFILRALSQSNQDGATRGDIYRVIKRSQRDYPQANLTTYLDKLSTEEYGSILRHDSISGLYSFSDPIYRVFALALFDKDRPSSHIAFNANLDSKEIFKRLWVLFSHSRTHALADVKGGITGTRNDTKQTIGIGVNYPSQGNKEGNKSR